MPTASLPAIRPPRAPFPKLAIAAFALALTAAGCSSRTSPETTGAIALNPSFTDADWRRERETWGPRYEKSPGDKVAALRFARALRGLGQHQQAVAVLQQIAVVNPKDMQVLGAYGKTLIDVGRLNEAQEVLSRAHTPDRPDWSILAAQGVVADQLGDHIAAQRFYDTALKIRPDEPSLLANLGFSYALTKRLPEAEALLRRAAESPKADARVRQNLVLVLGLQGKFAEAEQVAQRDLSPIEAAQNIAYLKQVVTQPNAWKQLAKGGQPAPGGPPPQKVKVN